MIERCIECEGPKREACDARFAALAQLMMQDTEVAIEALGANDLLEIMTVEDELAAGMDKFLDDQEVAGCQLDTQAVYGRLVIEMQLQPWKQSQ